MKLATKFGNPTLARIAPARGRGLKLVGAARGGLGVEIAPARGRGLKLCAPGQYRRARAIAPARGRGLKLRSGVDQEPLPRSPPRGGAD